jgi:hypothetical protein
MSLVGLVSRVTPVHTALRNCTRDEGRSFEVGNQVLISRQRVSRLCAQVMPVELAFLFRRASHGGCWEAYGKHSAPIDGAPLRPSTVADRRGYGGRCSRLKARCPMARLRSPHKPTTHDLRGQYGLPWMPGSTPSISMTPMAFRRAPRRPGCRAARLDGQRPRAHGLAQIRLVASIRDDVPAKMFGAIKLSGQSSEPPSRINRSI